jgi:hypothetical protein
MVSNLNKIFFSAYVILNLFQGPAPAMPPFSLEALK